MRNHTLAFLAAGRRGTAALRRATAYTGCLECIEIDCPFGGMLLGLGPDFDQSGVVDDTDLELMMIAMGLTKGRFDMNKDGVVGEKDLVMLLDDYGKTVETK